GTAHAARTELMDNKARTLATQHLSALERARRQPVLRIDQLGDHHDDRGRLQSGQAVRRCELGLLAPDDDGLDTAWMYLARSGWGQVRRDQLRWYADRKASARRGAA